MNVSGNHSLKKKFSFFLNNYPAKLLSEATRLFEAGGQVMATTPTTPSAASTPHWCEHRSAHGKSDGSTGDATREPPAARSTRRQIPRATEPAGCVAAPFARARAAHPGASRTCLVGAERGLALCSRAASRSFVYLVALFGCFVRLIPRCAAACAWLDDRRRFLLETHHQVFADRVACKT